MNKTEFEKDFYERLISSMKKHGLETCAASVFLTGSFGRGEVTYSYDGDDVTLKSDVEIGIVYMRKRAVYKMIEAVSAEFEEDLNCMAFSITRMIKLDNFNNAILPRKHKTLFMYDLVNGNKHLWGKDFLKNANIPLENVDLYEAKRIVANRIGELVYTRVDDVDEVRWQAKLVAAVGSAYLLCNGTYKCSYREQLEQIKAASADLDVVVGKGFAEKYEAAYMYLRQGAASFDTNDEELRLYVKNINDYFKKFEIRSPRVNTISRKVKYALKCVQVARTLNIIGAEERIINALIRRFVNNSEKLAKTAELWYKVLY